MLTRRQINAITKIQRHHARSGCEIKEFRVRMIGRKAFVVCELGVKGDEGTLTALLCRTRGAFAVGVRGSIEALHPRRGVASKAKRYPLIYGWT